MEVKNLQNIISECITYADEISKNPELYPSDAKMPLRDFLRYDMIMFLGYLYEPGNPNLADQVEFIKANLRMILEEDKFLKLVETKCTDPNFLLEVPKSIEYFIKADLADVNVETGSGHVSRSKFVVDAFRKLGEGFTNYETLTSDTSNKLKNYIQILKDALAQEGIVKEEAKPTMGIKGRGTGAASQFSAVSKPDIETKKTYDEKTGRFTVKKAINVSGYNIMKKRADDISEFSNFIGDDEDMNDEEKVFTRGDVRVGGKKDDASEQYEKNIDELIEELQSLIGLGSVKEDVMHLINIIKVRKLRQKLGLKRIDMSFHLVFTGNPGTGKTTVARLLAKIYKQLGLVSKGQFIEVDRSGLVDHFSGGTALKTTEVIDRAIGGILFIDEAYTLTHNKDAGDYGQEAVDTLLKRMEDDRDDFIVIVAGYSGPMAEFIGSNPGLKSRFNKFIDFPDYSSMELMEIFKLMCHETDYELTESAASIAQNYLTGIAQGKKENFANARLVRNYFERCIDRQATRLVQDKKIDKDDLLTFVREDMMEPVNGAPAALLEEKE